MNTTKGLITVGGIFITLLVVTGIVTATVMSARADGRIDHCFIDRKSSSVPTYIVYGHRSWRPDADLGFFTDPSAAETFMRAHVSCSQQPSQ